MSAILVGANPSVTKPLDVKIYGIEWNYANTSTACTRLEVSASFAEPAAAVGTSGGSSPFDSCYPWSEMTEYNVISNAVSYAKGNASFSRTSYDTVVRIPKFYIKVEKDTANSKLRIYIADGAATGFVVHPAFSRGDGSVRDYIYVGKYNTGSGYVTKSGLAPLASITRATFRTNSASKGTPWWQYDYAAYNAIWMLYIVEWADWNSQTKIGRGYVDGSAAINNGGCDALTYHTGRASGTDGLTAVQYRWIENPWGNVYDFVDGMNFYGAQPYFCLNPSNFADDTSTNYTSLGYVIAGTSGNFISLLGLDANNPMVLLPTATGGSETTYIPDRLYLSTTASWYIFYVGGSSGDASSAGLFCSLCRYASSTTGANFGGRLLFLP